MIIAYLVIKSVREWAWRIISSCLAYPHENLYALLATVLHASFQDDYKQLSQKSVIKKIETFFLSYSFQEQKMQAELNQTLLNIFIRSKIFVKVCVPFYIAFLARMQIGKISD